MIEDGHFKEMKFILDYIYQKRVEFKKMKMTKAKNTIEEGTPKQKAKLEAQTDILNMAKSKKSDFVVKNLETKKGVKIDMNQIEDLYDEAEMLEEIDPKDLVVDEIKDEDEKEEEKKNKKKRVNQQQVDQENEERFAKEYKKMGGIQHIICSATMTIDQNGRITPKKAKRLKKQGMVKAETTNTLE